MLQIGSRAFVDGAVFISRIICLGFLIGLAVSDIRYRKVPTACLITGSVLAAVYCLIFQREQWILSTMGLLVGAGFVLISKVTREGLGYGDSIMICVLGIYLGLWALLEILLITWGLASVAAVVILMKRKSSRKAAIPLVPFITIGYLVMWSSELIAG